MSRRRMMQGQGETLPSGYKQCKYLESSGGQIIRTGIKIKKGDLIFVSASSLSQKDFNTIIGADIGSSVELYFSNYVVKHWNGTVYSIIKKVDGIYGFGNIINIEFEITDLPINKIFHYVLFAYVDSYNLIGRIYKIDIAGKSNLIPCLAPSGRPCMYDTVTEQPFYNSGSGEFGYELLDGTYVAPT